MATPPRLVELQCPRCGVHHWEIDHDFRGMHPDAEIPYPKRTYRCPHCSVTGDGYAVGRKSPPEFFLQPHPMYPMTSKEFDEWVGVVRGHFPDHPMLAELGKTWYPHKSLLHRVRRLMGRAWSD